MGKRNWHAMISIFLRLSRNYISRDIISLLESYNFQRFLTIERAANWKKIVESDKFAIYPYFLYGEMGQVLGRHLQRLTFQSKIVYRRVYRSLRFLNGFKNIFAPFRILRKKKKGRKKGKRKKSLFQNPRVINLRGAFPIKFFIRWLHTGQRANKHR